MDRHPRKVLIVEDDEATNEALTKVLRLDGWAVYSARTVAEGIHLLKSAPDIVLLDLLLPDGEGQDVLNAMKDAAFNHVSVVIMTGREGDEGKGRLWASGKVIGYLQKPIDFQDLFFLIKPRTE